MPFSVTYGGNFPSLADLPNFNGYSQEILDFIGGDTAGKLLYQLNAAGLRGTADVQSTKLDTTAGKLLTVGAFGLGVVTGSDDFTLPDLDATDTPTGLYRLTATTANVASAPTGASGLGVVLVQRYDTDDLVQTLTDKNLIDGHRTYIRKTSNGVWQAWSPMLIGSDIIGTVSETSGVPDGAIFEEGSNANGQYVRYANGIQTCRMQNFTTASGGAAVWTYPATFSAEVVVTATARVSSPRTLGTLPVGAGLVSAEIYSFDEAGADTVAPGANLLAQGYWTNNL